MGMKYLNAVNLEILDRIYYWFPQTNIFWRGLRFCCRVLMNRYVKYMMPVRNRNNKVVKKAIIISLTSFPTRIKNVWMTCATLLNQDVDNVHVVLWLSKEQFPRGMADLPKKLIWLTDKGLDIRFVNDDLRPHKKYVCACRVPQKVSRLRGM